MGDCTIPWSASLESPTPGEHHGEHHGIQISEAEPTQISQHLVFPRWRQHQAPSAFSEWLSSWLSTERTAASAISKKLQSLLTEGHAIQQPCEIQLQGVAILSICRGEILWFHQGVHRIYGWLPHCWPAYLRYDPKRHARVIKRLHAQKHYGNGDSN